MNICIQYVYIHLPISSPMGECSDDDNTISLHNIAILNIVQNNDNSLYNHPFHDIQHCLIRTKNLPGNRKNPENRVPVMLLLPVVVLVVPVPGPVRGYVSCVLISCHDETELARGIVVVVVFVTILVLLLLLASRSVDDDCDRLIYNVCICVYMYTHKFILYAYTILFIHTLQVYYIHGLYMLYTGIILIHIVYTITYTTYIH